MSVSTDTDTWSDASFSLRTLWGLDDDSADLAGVSAERVEPSVAATDPAGDRVDEPVEPSVAATDPAGDLVDEFFERLAARVAGTAGACDHHDEFRRLESKLASVGRRLAEVDGRLAGLAREARRRDRRSGHRLDAALSHQAEEILGTLDAWFPQPAPRLRRKALLRIAGVATAGAVAVSAATALAPYFV